MDKVCRKRYGGEGKWGTKGAKGDIKGKEGDRRGKEGTEYFFFENNLKQNSPFHDMSTIETSFRNDNKAEGDSCMTPKKKSRIPEINNKIQKSPTRTLESPNKTSVSSNALVSAKIKRLECEYKFMKEQHLKLAQDSEKREKELENEYNARLAKFKQETEELKDELMNRVSFTEINLENKTEEIEKLKLDSNQRIFKRNLAIVMTFLVSLMLTIFSLVLLKRLRDSEAELENLKIGNLVRNMGETGKHRIQEFFNGLFQSDNPVEL